MMETMEASNLELLQARLVSLDAIRPEQDGIQVQTLDAIAPTYAACDWQDSIPEELQVGIRRLGIERLFQHQAEAIHRILSGEDVVITTPTASGKTLCFNVPMTANLLKRSDTHALVVHPMKALTNDQRHQLVRLWSACDASHLRSWVYDGDTPADHRQAIRANPPQVVFTNPEMLNVSFLGSSDKWSSFLKQVKYIVFDEIHEYRGFFGSNVSLLLRRFLRKLEELGQHPQVVLASATCGNPAEHAFALTGRQCTTVNALPMRPRRHYVFIAPKIDAHHYSKVYPLRIALAGLACVKQGLMTLVFTPSRKFCEEVTRIAKRKAMEFGVNPDQIVCYRSGYTPEQRRDIEDKMRSGFYRLVFATSALEVGINVGYLDAIVLAGFPDNIMSAWQRIGRAGRSMNAEAFVLFYAMNNPYDRFMAANVNLLLNKPLDELVVNYENEELVKRHLPCLLFEKNIPLTSDDRAILGNCLYESAKAKEGSFKRVLNIRFAPHGRLPIRDTHSGQYKIMSEKKEIGTISEEQKIREAYLGAIYVHLGRQYRVKSHSVDEIEVTPISAELNRKTVPKTWSSANVVQIFEGFRYRGGLASLHGKMTIFSNYGGYKEEDEISGEVIDDVTTEVVARQRTVHAFWLECEEIPADMETKALDVLFPMVMPMIEGMFRVAVPFVVPCDRYDIRSFSSDSMQSLYIYETVPGGIGISRKVFAECSRVLRQGVSIAASCKCDYGCPRCIAFQASLEDLRVTKAVAITCAEDIIQRLEGDPVETFNKEYVSWQAIES